MKCVGKLTASPLVRVVFFSGVLCGGCSGDGSDAPPDQALVGNWQPGEGDLFAFFPGVDFLVLQLRDDSGGVAVFQEPETKALACADLIYSRLSDQTLLIDVEAFNEAATFLPKTFAYVVEAEALTLRDSVGRTQVFSKLEELPAGAQCKHFAEVATVGEIEADPVGGTGLVWDRQSLWFGANAQPNQLVPVDHTTGEPRTPVDLPSGIAEVQAYDGFRLWFRTGVSYIASLRDFADTERDTIDTDLDLRHKLFIDAMAWDGEFLWLAGLSDASRRHHFLKVNTATKSLISENRFDIELQAPTWNGGHFWAIVARSAPPIVKIDPATLQTVATYEIPGVDPFFHDYLGIAAVGDDLYILVREWVSDPATAMIIRATS